MKTRPDSRSGTHTDPHAEAWRAVEQRDASWDGRVFYGVRTTGVFCRPSCSSKRPIRRNVAFFTSATDAERAGFRACKRCRPTEAPDDPGARLVERARQLLDASESALTLEELAARCRTTPFVLRRAFVRLVGLSPKAYQDARRVSRLRTELRRSPTVSRAVYEAGYGSGSRAYDRQRSGLGVTPGAFRRGAPGTQVAHAIVDSPYGRVLVAATARGVCAVALGKSDAELLAELRREYPRAELVAEGDAADRLREVVDDVIATISGRRHGRVPLDVDGTAFQWQVWDALRKLPRGRTTSYAELAAALGRPGAARAVARACASNRVAVVIPCHRVIRGDGELGGYRWGLERKAALLRDEQGNR